MWRDVDGSLGLPPGSTVVSMEDESFTDEVEGCYRREDWNLKVCPGYYGKVRFVCWDFT